VDDPSRLARTDEYGNIVWEKNYSGTNNEPLVIYDVSETKDGGLIMAATTSDEEQVPYSILIKTNSAGEELWRKKIFDYTNATSVIQAKDGGFVIGGMYDFKKDDSADWKAFIAKTDSRGFTMPLFN
jgi:hypothetical protein